MVGFINSLLSSEESFQKLLSLFLQVLRCFGPSDQPIDRFFHLLLHLLLHFSGYTFEIHSIGRCLCGAGNRERKTQSTVFDGEFHDR